MVVDIVAQLNVLIVNINAAILVVQVEVGGGSAGPGAEIGPTASKADILAFNMQSIQALLVLYEAIAVDPIAATASGTSRHDCHGPLCPGRHGFHPYISRLPLRW